MERLAVLLIIVFHLARGNYEVSVQLSRYSNNNHRHHNGDCCDLFSTIFTGCLGNCDNYFIICLEDEEEENVCRNSGDLGSHDSINFDSTVGRLTNPITFVVDGRWTEELTVSVTVYDDDITNGDDLIDEFIITSTTDGLQNRRGRFNQASLTFSASVSCSSGYYGQDCSVECEPDPTSHWCNSNGNRVCINGWTGEWCDVCTTSVLCSESGGYCVEPGDCICRDGFTGPYCNPIISSPSISPTTEYIISTPVMLPHNPTTIISPPATSVSSLLIIIPTSVTPVSTNIPLEQSETPTITGHDKDSTGLSNTFESSQPQPILRRNGSDGVGHVVGGVLAGLAILVIISILVILGAWLCWCRRRERKKNDANDLHPLVRPLMGENPMYMDHAMGTHQNGREYHQFTNPLYSVHNTMPCRTDSPIYSYPVNRQSHLLTNVYLPGDESPLSSSLSLHQPPGSPSRGQYDVSEPEGEGGFRNEGVTELTINGTREHRTISISDQYFHLPHQT